MCGIKNPDLSSNFLLNAYTIPKSYVVNFLNIIFFHLDNTVQQILTKLMILTKVDQLSPNLLSVLLHYIIFYQSFYNFEGVAALPNATYILSRRKLTDDKINVIKIEDSNHDINE